MRRVKIKHSVRMFTSKKAHKQNYIKLTFIKLKTARYEQDLFSVIYFQFLLPSSKLSISFRWLVSQTTNAYFEWFKKTIVKKLTNALKITCV